MAEICKHGNRASTCVTCAGERIAELERQFDALKHERNVLQKICAERSDELAAAQATIQQMREALQAMHDEKCDYMRRNNLGDPLRETVATELVLPALALPADRTALDAMLAEARKEQAEKDARICDEADKSTHPADLADAIRQAAERSGE